MGIDCSAFTWEAFATLVTGLAAVGAAWRVGSRQLDILKQQNTLKEQELRISLLQERLTVYETVLKYCNAVVSSQKIPSAEIVFEFNSARTKARFLFSNELNEMLRDISVKSQELDSYTSKNKNVAFMGSQVTQDEVDEAHKAITWLAETFFNLHVHFAEISPSLDATRANPAPALPKAPLPRVPSPRHRAH